MRRAPAAALLLALALGGCGVPRDGSTRALAEEEVPYGLLGPAPSESSTPAATAQGVVTPRVWFLDADRLLVPSALAVPAGGPGAVVDELLGQLSSGPGERLRDQGLASALGPGVELDLVALEGGTATVDVSPLTQDPSADRLPLAVGQVVLTVTSVPGVDRVQLVQDGDELEVPRPGGARTSAPVTAADYLPLTAPADPAP